VSEIGRHAGVLPPGWERLADETCICEHCVERRRELVSSTAR
jgi:hypothetical protein